MCALWSMPSGDDGICDPKEFQIVLEDGNGGCFAKTLEEILPFGFGPANLREEE